MRLVVGELCLLDEYQIRKALFMKSHELAGLVLRLLAIYCFIDAVAQLRGLTLFIQLFTGGGGGVFPGKLGTAIAMIFPMVIMVAYGVCLLRYARPLSRLVAGDVAEKVVASSLSGEELLPMAFAVAGVVIMASAVQALCHNIGLLIYVRDQFISDQMQSRIWIDLCAGGLKLLIGAGLFLGCHGLGRLWHRLRTAGTAKVDA